MKTETLAYFLPIFGQNKKQKHGGKKESRMTIWSEKTWEYFDRKTWLLMERNNILRISTYEFTHITMHHTNTFVLHFFHCTAKSIDYV